MSFETLDCPACGAPVAKYRNPVPTVDIIVEQPGGIVLIKRRNPPHGWALPGGFVDYGESLEAAALREAREETALELCSLKLLGCYSDPARDDRLHTVSTVYIARGSGTLRAGDDAAGAEVFSPDNLPSPICFDHAQIIRDYLKVKQELLTLP